MNDFAAVLRHLGVGHGDRVVIYMPNMAEAVFAMLACARIGAVHSVVFGGFAAHNLALRIDDAKPKLLIAADAGMRGGKLIPYSRWSMQLRRSHVATAARADRRADWMPPNHACRAAMWSTPRCVRRSVRSTPVQWLESSEPSYLLYTRAPPASRRVQRDVGGYAVAMAQSMETVFDCRPGQVMFSTSDVGWAVGHSYNVYGPLIGGCTSLLYEGLPTNPDPGIWWRCASSTTCARCSRPPLPSAC